LDSFVLLVVVFLWCLIDDRVSGRMNGMALAGTPLVMANEWNDA